MNHKWIAGVDSDEKERRFDLVNNSRALLTLLAKIVQQEINLLGQSPFSDYEHPGWAFKEADRKGQIRALKNVLSLCDNQVSLSQDGATEGSHNA